MTLLDKDNDQKISGLITSRLQPDTVLKVYLRCLEVWEHHRQLLNGSRSSYIDHKHWCLAPLLVTASVVKQAQPQTMPFGLLGTQFVIIVTYVTTATAFQPS